MDITKHLGLAYYAVRVAPRFCIRVLGREEATSIAFFCLASAAKDYDPMRGTWSSFALLRMRSAIYDAAVSQLRRINREQEVAAMSHEDRYDESDLEAEELRDAIQDVMDSLPEAERLAVLRRYAEVGIPDSPAERARDYRAWAKAREKLREKLQEFAP